MGKMGKMGKMGSVMIPTIPMIPISPAAGRMEMKVLGAAFVANFSFQRFFWGQNRVR